MGAEPLWVPAGELGAFPSALEPFIAVDDGGVTVVNSDSHQHQRPAPSTLGVHTCRRRVTASLTLCGVQLPCLWQTVSPSPLQMLAAISILLSTRTK